MSIISLCIPLGLNVNRAIELELDERPVAAPGVGRTKKRGDLNFTSFSSSLATIFSESKNAGYGCGVTMYTFSLPLSLAVSNDFNLFHSSSALGSTVVRPYDSLSVGGVIEHGGNGVVVVGLCCGDGGGFVA